jgi:serine/threonine-protein kinase
VVPGSIIAGKYRLSRVLGEGAMGVVWAAVNQLTEREVALKLIPSAASEELRTRLLREARACGRIAHRNVVEIYDVGEADGGAPFLVMQLLSGETLQARLAREKRLPQALAVKIGSEIAKGLVAAHGAHIVHRDLKPGNVFLHHDEGEGEVVKLLDFGVSKLLTRDVSSTATGSAIGSPAYMSPEQAKGLKDVGPRADLWALGVVLFEMIAGRRPFDGATPYAVVAEILDAEIPKLEVAAPGTDAQLCALVARCLERDIYQRVSSATEVQITLQSAMAVFRGSVPELGARRSAVSEPAPPLPPPGAGARRSAMPIAPLAPPVAITGALPWTPEHLALTPEHLASMLENRAEMPEDLETVRLSDPGASGSRSRPPAPPEPLFEGPGAFRDPLSPAAFLVDMPPRTPASATPPRMPAAVTPPRMPAAVTPPRMPASVTPPRMPAPAPEDVFRSQWPTGQATQDPSTITSTSAVLAPSGAASGPLSFAPAAPLPSLPAPQQPAPSLRTLVIAAVLSVIAVVTAAVLIIVLKRSDPSLSEKTPESPTIAAPQVIGESTAAPGASSATPVLAETGAAVEPPAIEPTASAAAPPTTSSAAVTADAPPKTTSGAPKTTRPSGSPGSTAPKSTGTTKGTAPSTKKKSGNPAPRATW